MSKSDIHLCHFCWKCHESTIPGPWPQHSEGGMSQSRGTCQSPPEHSLVKVCRWSHPNGGKCRALHLKLPRNIQIFLYWYKPTWFLPLKYKQEENDAKRWVQESHSNISLVRCCCFPMNGLFFHLNPLFVVLCQVSPLFFNTNIQNPDTCGTGWLHSTQFTTHHWDTHAQAVLHRLVSSPVHQHEQCLFQIIHDLFYSRLLTTSHCSMTLQAHSLFVPDLCYTVQIASTAPLSWIFQLQPAYILSINYPETQPEPDTMPVSCWGTCVFHLFQFQPTSSTFFWTPPSVSASHFNVFSAIRYWWPLLTGLWSNTTTCSNQTDKDCSFVACQLKQNRTLMVLRW